jgi:hypothetical protein
MINEMKGGIKRRKKVDRAKINIKYIESEQREEWDSFWGEVRMYEYIEKSQALYRP